jgi:hypothetical protein
MAKLLTSQNPHASLDTHPHDGRISPMTLGSLPPSTSLDPVIPRIIMIRVVAQVLATALHLPYLELGLEVTQSMYQAEEFRTGNGMGNTLT